MTKPEDDDPWQAFAKKVQPLPKLQPVSPKQILKRVNTKSPQVIPDPDQNDFASMLEGKSVSSTFMTRDVPPAKSQKLLCSPATLPRRKERALRRGDIVPEARLDLHGLTEAAANQSVVDFINSKYRQGYRWLLIITGKGRGSDGKLRRNFPGWCATPELTRLILTLRPAALRHGGQGAWYVGLRRQR